MSNDRMYALIGAGIGVVGVIVGVWSNGRLNKVLRKLDKAVEDFSEKDVDISSNIVNSAVESAANKVVKRCVEDDNSYILHDAANTLKEAAREAVNNEIKNFKPAIESKVNEKIADISLDGVKADVINRAAKTLTDKCSRDLDYVTDDYKKQLDNIIKIFKKSVESTTSNKIVFTNF